MGKIVAAFGQSHVMFDNHGIEDQASVVFDGYKEIGEKVRAANPDVLIVISGDHFYNVTTAQQIPLAVSVGDTHVPFGDMDCPKTPFKGHREFGEGFAEFTAERGFDLAKLEEEGFKPDHGVVLPVMFINPTGDIPTVIINVNINFHPTPSPQRCAALGSALKEFIETVRPAEERVAVVAAGGISHWLMIERDGEINEEWDEEVLQTFAQGKWKELAKMSIDDIVEIGGNGGTEVIYWIMMAATVPNAKGTKLFYEPIYPWKTGMGAVEMHV